MTVSRDDLERALEELRREVTRPEAGIWGPGTVAWMVTRELVTFLAGGRAILLQLAHPFVASAIDQHSSTRHDPIGRFRRTFRFVYAMSFGDLDHACDAARRVHHIHQHVRGTVGEAVGPYEPASRYEANDEEALLWVHATLFEGAVCAFEAILRPLSVAERDQLLVESRRFGRLFGIPPAMIPARWDDFLAYNQRMWGWLRATTPAREIAGFILDPPLPLPKPLMGTYAILTAGLLPEPVRAQFGLPFGRKERLVYGAALRAARLGYRALPRELRRVPAYQQALARLRGDPQPERVAKRLQHLLFEADLGTASR